MPVVLRSAPAPLATELYALTLTDGRAAFAIETDTIQPGLMALLRGKFFWLGHVYKIDQQRLAVLTSDGWGVFHRDKVTLLRLIE